MSRYITDGKDERGRYYIETLADENGCKHDINDICCNEKNRDRLGYVAYAYWCEKCPFFEPEPSEEIPQLRVGRVTHD